MINRKNSPLFGPAKQRWGLFVQTYSGPFDLSRAEYTGMNHPVTFGCPVHGWRKMAAKYVMANKGCVMCYREGLARKPRLTLKKTLARFVECHGDTYDYSRTEYKGQSTPVEIICPRHGSFFQKPEYHWTGSGCPKCYENGQRGASQRDTLDGFYQKVEKLFPKKFSVFGPYLNSQTRLVVLCKEHGAAVHTKPNYLLNGYNPCPQCNHMKSSAEESIAAYLERFTTVVRRDRTLIGPKEIDIYLPEQNLAVEYCGMYWHSHADREDERKNKRRHAEKRRLCEEKGVRLITLYETEWLERPETVKRMLRNAVGHSRGKLMARKCQMAKPTSQEARAFYEKYHPQGGSGYGDHYGLYYKGKLVACMRFTFGGNDRGHGAKERQWTLSRYATRLPVAGAASRLFKAFVKEQQPPEVKSFSDNRWFGGGMYAQLGFVLEDAVPSDYQVWSPKLGLRPKPHYQRRLLQKRLEEHGVDERFDPAQDSRTEAEMTYFMGARRIYDCGKKRWLWTPPA